MSALHTLRDRLSRSLGTLARQIDREALDSPQLYGALRSVCSTLMNSAEFEPALAAIVTGSNSSVSGTSTVTPNSSVAAGMNNILPLLLDENAQPDLMDASAAHNVLACMNWLIRCHDAELSSPIAILGSIRTLEYYLERSGIDGFDDGELEMIQTEVSELIWRIDQVLEHPCRWHAVQQNANRMHFDLLSKLEKLKGVSSALEHAAEQWPRRVDGAVREAVAHIGDSLEAAIWFNLTAEECGVGSGEKPQLAEAESPNEQGNESSQSNSLADRLIHPLGTEPPAKYRRDSVADGDPCGPVNGSRTALGFALHGDDDISEQYYRRLFWKKAENASVWIRESPKAGELQMFVIGFSERNRCRLRVAEFEKRKSSQQNETPDETKRNPTKLS